MRLGARHVTEVGLVGLVGRGTLPVGEGVGQHVGHHGVLHGVGGEEVVGSAVGELVPAVGGTDGGAGEVLPHGADVVVELGAGQVAAVEGLGTDGDGLDDAFGSGHGLSQSRKVLLEGGIVGAHVALVLGADPKKWNRSDMSKLLPSTEKDLPDTKDNLEALVLGGRQDVLSTVTFGGRVGADEGSQVLQVVKVGLVVAGGLAAAIGSLVTEREAQSATGRDDGRGSSQNKRQEARNTHDEAIRGGLVERKEDPKTGGERKSRSQGTGNQEQTGRNDNREGMEFIKEWEGKRQKWWSGEREGERERETRVQARLLGLCRKRLQPRGEMAAVS